MSQLNYKGDQKIKSLDELKRDVFFKNLIVRSPKSIIAEFDRINAEDKNRLLLNLTLAVKYLLEDQIE